MYANDAINQIHAIAVNAPMLKLNSSDTELEEMDNALADILALTTTFIQENCHHDWRFRNGKNGHDDYMQCPKCGKCAPYEREEIGDIMNELAEARDDE